MESGNGLAASTGFPVLDGRLESDRVHDLSTDPRRPTDCPTSLANLREGESCPSLVRLSAGPVGCVVSLLAGLNLTFVLLARDELHRTCSVGGPTADSVALLIRLLLDDRSSDSSADCVPGSVAGQVSHLSSFAAIRSPWIENGGWINLLMDCTAVICLSSWAGRCLESVKLGSTVLWGAVRDSEDVWVVALSCLVWVALSCLSDVGGF